MRVSITLSRTILYDIISLVYELLNLAHSSVTATLHTILYGHTERRHSKRWLLDSPGESGLELLIPKNVLMSCACIVGGMAPHSVPHDSVRT